MLIGFLGSRSLDDARQALPLYRPLRAQFQALAAAGDSVAVGCAVGADMLALTTALELLPPARISVYAVGGRTGEGFPGGRLPSWIDQAFRAGCRVEWWAGGGPQIPLRARLLLRSRALVAAVASAQHGGEGGELRAFLGPGRSAGSWGTLEAGAAAGLRLVVTPCAGCPLPLRPLGFGDWALIREAGGSCLEWRPAL